MLVGAFPNEEEVGLSNKQWCWTLHLQTFWFPCLLRELGSDFVPAGFEGLSVFGSPGLFGEYWPWCSCHGSLATELCRGTSLCCSR